VRGYDFFIRRPVLTWMLTLSLVVFGLLGYRNLGVDQFPEMEFPVVTVTALLEGASPEVVEQDVTDPLEEQLNTIAGVRSIESTSLHGVSQIKIEFDLGRDIDVAAQDVRDKIALARYELPKEVEPPVVTKEDTGGEAVIWLPIHSDRPMVEVSEFVKRTIKPRLETIPGVAGTLLFGEQERAIRLWLDGDALRAHGLAASDVLAAVQREHVDVPGGRVESRRLNYAVKTDAEFRSVAELEDLIVAWGGDAPVRLREVARVEDGTVDAQTVAHFDGVPTVGIGIRKQSDANTVAVVDEVWRRVDAMRDTIPAGFELPARGKAADFSKAIRESVDETVFSLWTGAILATLTVLVFLRRTRPTLIVGASIPVSLVATFGVMWIFGHTLNTMTLLALALAVGVVVDDAIVVLENIERHRELGESPWEAASKGTREIAFAATAATLSIAVVFLPTIFVKGIVGSFLGEFGVAVASAVLISLVVALTLTPMLAARMPPPEERAHGGFYHRLEVGFEWLERSYRRVLAFVLVHRGATLAGALVSFLVALGFARGIGSEFFPTTDNALLFVRFETPAGTNLETTAEFLARNEAWALAQPEVAGMFSGAGFGGPNSPGRFNMGMMFVMLKPKKERERTVQDLVPAARAVLQSIPGQQVRVLDPSKMMTLGEGTDFSFELQGNVDLVTLDQAATALVDELGRRRGFADLHKSLKMGLPELRVIPDREKAAALGVDARALAGTIQMMIGGMDVATFKEGGERFDIRVRLEADDRDSPESIGELYVRTREGDVVELRNLVSVETGAAPAEITRKNRQRSVTVSGALQDGLSLDQALEQAREVASRVLPEGVSLALSGTAEAFQESLAEFGLAITLAVLVIYMLLAAQFESLVHPFTVMLALPLALVGALGALYALNRLDLVGLIHAPGMTLNLFSLIGMILLMGLVTKNSILLVDYANQLRGEGLDKLEAMRRAAPVRMRPVLMTSVAMIFGVLPAAVGVGPGAETRQSMAVAVAAGMVSSTLLTLLVVPAFYLVLDDALEAARRLARRGLRRPPAAAPPERATALPRG
jgi:HAE1 family hydrophobic/amphiphilic exporter-1